MLRFSLVRGTVALCSLATVVQSVHDYSQYVNPFIGSEGPDGTSFGGGDIFVGGAVPFGVVKIGLDTTAADLSTATLNGGWTPDGNVTAVTMMHESGTGGEPKYGIIPQMPLTKVDSPVNILDNTTYSQPRVGKDVAKVGYFKTELENGVTIELSSARHSGIIQYSFPKGEKHVLVDISHYLPAGLGSPNEQYYVAGQVDVEEDGTYTGYGSYIGGWNNGAPYTVYFCGEFEDAPDDSRVFTGTNTDPIPRYQSLVDEPIPEPVFVDNSTSKLHATSGPLNQRLGALFSWNSQKAGTVTSRIGISFMSSGKACNYIKKEIPSWKLDDSVDAAKKEWNKDVFSKVQVPVGPSANKTKLSLLYSSLYFMHMMPSDRTGENPLWDSGEPYFDDFYTLWDIFRSLTSFYLIVQPSYFEGMVRSLIDIYKHQGFMPDGRSGNWNGLVQGGSNADNVLADAYVKGVKGAINWTEGYEAMVKDAEVLPSNYFDRTDMTASTKEGRGALNDWLELGYVSADRNTRCLSRTVEYALNDFALSQVADGEKPSDKAKYLKRSAGWQLSWNHDVKSAGFQGFLAPKLANGNWNLTDYDPLLCGGCEWDSITYEAVPFEYSFVLPHDMKTLISFMGGEKSFEKRLDHIFMPNSSKQDLGANGAGITTIMNIGNEPDFQTPYLFNYINKQYKSVNQSRALANQYFRDVPYGVPGNSDAGAMNGWLFWQMLGMYPVVTQTTYLLGSPWFSDLNMTVGDGNTLRITADDLSEESYFVQSVKINGKAWDKNWVEHDDLFTEGGHLHFKLGKKLTKWETGDVPPSPGHFTIDS